MTNEQKPRRDTLMYCVNGLSKSFIYTLGNGCMYQDLTELYNTVGTYDSCYDISFFTKSDINT